MTFKELTTESEIQGIIKYHNEFSDYVVLDLETTGLNPFKDKITDIVINGEDFDIIYILPGSYISLFANLRKPLVCHNFRFDFNMAYRAGVDFRFQGLKADTMLLDHLLDENQEHSLDSIVKRRYNDNYKELFWEKNKEYSLAPKNEQLTYACKDVYYTAQIYHDSVQELNKFNGQQLYQHVLFLATALYDTEIAGLRLDLAYIEQIGNKLSQRIKSLKEEMRKLAEFEIIEIENKEYLKVLESYKTDKGRLKAKRSTFNFDSSQQLSSLLYDALRLTPQFSKTKKRTCDDAALERLESEHRIIPQLREYRGHQKVYTAFIEGSLSKMHEGRIHPSFNVNGTVTGRISSSNPNMQQLPKEGGVRGIYIPEAGYCFITSDYSQLEVTLAAHFSRDTNLLRIVYEGASQHDITAKGLNIDRATAKTINFALQYGAGVHKIQKILGCSQSEAEQALARYWSTYSGLREFIKKCHDKVDKGEPLINPFGRRRRFPISEHDSFWDRERMKRQAANSLIQGTGADITNRAFYLVNNSLLMKNLGKALFPIHDEILIMVKNNPSSIEQSRQILSDIMVNVGKEIKLTVPLAVECSKPMIRWDK